MLGRNPCRIDFEFDVLKLPTDADPSTPDALANLIGAQLSDPAVLDDRHPDRRRIRCRESSRHVAQGLAQPRLVPLRCPTQRGSTINEEVGHEVPGVVGDTSDGFVGDRRP